eukprot:CAMPEP_0202865646 /NCGR_PEP_ID=MMETSP1391-20130828/6275_1 /ASSEMBLY_ACC=CAM_ASM_000867 /TAXON_ID=1034604 /ORGANISM="Chlamydomonas leiostraca, Strain SAG 11-49" /LENGTH=55 /DNA_ID=CAMNT_0049545509 /DNA_START=110 /DNA_END=277 /DNA_ORIENTATION=+
MTVSPLSHENAGYACGPRVQGCSPENLPLTEYLAVPVPSGLRSSSTLTLSPTAYF